MIFDWGVVVISRPTDTSAGVIQYDFGKTVSKGRFKQTGSLNAVSTLQSRHLIEEPELAKHLMEMTSKDPKLKTAVIHQGALNDQFFEATYNHQVGEDTCSDCDVLQTISRPERIEIIQAVYYGLIASANQVMKDGATREKLQKQMNVMCLEVEAAAFMDKFPCLIIRRICNYAATHKNKRWRPYAAAVAAACAKELLYIIPANEVAQAQTATMICTNAGE